MNPFRPTAPAMALIAVTACAPVAPDIAALSEPQLVQLTEAPPPGADPAACWGKHVSPAVVETVTEQILLQPAEVLADGTVTSPAVYKTETRQVIVRERRETWFETPCPGLIRPTFIASLQRALAARELYSGPVDGRMTAATRAAIRRYQKPLGLDSGILSMAAARQLGLVAVEREG